MSDSDIASVMTTGRREEKKHEIMLNGKRTGGSQV